MQPLAQQGDLLPLLIALIDKGASPLAHSSAQAKLVLDFLNMFHLQVVGWVGRAKYTV